MNKKAKKTAPKAAPVKEMAKCHFCPRMVEKDDMFCHGCKTVICDKCDVSMGEYGHGHSPEDHRRDPEAEGDW